MLFPLSSIALSTLFLMRSRYFASRLQSSRVRQGLLLGVPPSIVQCFTRFHSDNAASYPLSRSLHTTSLHAQRVGNRGSSPISSAEEPTVIDWTKRTTPPPPTSSCGSSDSMAARYESSRPSEGYAASPATSRSLLSPHEYLSFLRSLTQSKWKALVQTGTVRAAGDHSLGLSGESPGDGEEATREALRYQSQLEMNWIEKWAKEVPLVEEPAEAAKVRINSPTPAESTIPPPQEKLQRRLLLKRTLLERIDYHKPLAYILGKHIFLGSEFACQFPVHCPTEETEMWVRWLLETHLEPALASDVPAESSPDTLHVLDMCSGTGCIGISIGKRLPISTRVVSVDVSAEAVQLAKENAVGNGFSLYTPGQPLPQTPTVDAARTTSPQRVFWAMQGDMFSAFRASNTRSPSTAQNAASPVALKELDPRFFWSFDLLVCHPPYLFQEEYAALAPHERYWNSELSLLGDEKRRGAAQYRYFQELCEIGWRCLKPRKHCHSKLRESPNFVVEVGEQAQFVASMMERMVVGEGEAEVSLLPQAPRWRDVEIHLDFHQRPRWISARSNH